MSSAVNGSIRVLGEMYIGHVKNYENLQNRFNEQETRLSQSPDQTGVLTTEQQDLNKRVKAVSDDFMAPARQLEELNSLFVDHSQAQENDQPQIRNQIQAKMGELDVMLLNVKGKVQELEEIKK